MSKKSNIISLGIGSSVERAISLSLIRFLKITLSRSERSKILWNKEDKNFKGLSVKQKEVAYKTAVKRFGNLPIQN